MSIKSIYSDCLIPWISYLLLNSRTCAFRVHLYIISLVQYSNWITDIKWSQENFHCEKVGIKANARKIWHDSVFRTTYYRKEWTPCKGRLTRREVSALALLWISQRIPKTPTEPQIIPLFDHQSDDSPLRHKTGQEIISEYKNLSIRESNKCAYKFRA